MPTTSMVEAALVLQCWLSPAFPVGAFAYSHGLEWAVETGDVRDEATLRAWLVDVLGFGAGRNDAILLAAAWRAAAAGNDQTLRDVNDLALATAGASELHLETAQQGRSFTDSVAATWPSAGLAARVDPLDEIALPVAVGIAAAVHQIPLRPTLAAFLTAFASNLVSAAVRLGPIGQTAGQRVLADLAASVPALAAETEHADLDDLGTATVRADLGVLRHETQYTRLFRS